MGICRCDHYGQREKAKWSFNQLHIVLAQAQQNNFLLF